MSFKKKIVLKRYFIQLYLFNFLVYVDRNSIWKSTLEFMMEKTPAQFVKIEMKIHYLNEIGIDAGP